MPFEFLIHEVVSSESLFVLADRLESFLDRLSHSKDKRKILDSLYRKMHIHNLYATPVLDGTQIYAEPESVLIFLANYWLWMPSARENVALLKKIVSDIRTNFRIGESSPLPYEVVRELMDIVDQRFDFTSRLFNGRQLKIIFLNNTHVKWNCYYSTTVEPGMQVLDECVVMTCMPQSSRHRQEFGFLHELGHLLHTYAEKQVSTVPASFAPSLEHIFSKTVALSGEDSSEFFADCFAIACLLGSPYANCDYTTYCAEDKAKILLYMAMLIEQSFPSDKRVPILDSFEIIDQTHER